MSGQGCPICGGPHVGIPDAKGVFHRATVCPGWRTAYHGPIGHILTVTDKKGAQLAISGGEMCGDCAAIHSKAQLWGYRPRAPWFEGTKAQLENYIWDTLAAGYTQPETALRTGLSESKIQRCIAKWKKRAKKEDCWRETPDLGLVHNEGEFVSISQASARDRSDYANVCYGTYDEPR